MKTNQQAKHLILFILLIILLVNPVYAESISEFKECNLCEQKINQLYDSGEINIIDYAVYKYYLAYDPFELPEEVRCDSHRNFVKSIDYLIENKNIYLNEKVKIVGIFKGWNGNYGNPPVTRSDWIIEDSSNGIYVLGAFPWGLHPGSKEDLGTEILLEGIFKKTLDNGVNSYYIESNKTTIISKGREH